MKTINLLTILLLVIAISSCNSTNKNIAQASDYEQYLSPNNNPKLLNAKKELDFWQAKFEKTPSQYPYLSKMANAHSQLFEATGDIAHLNEAYSLYKDINKKINNSNASYLRALARNCISQHKFKEAYTALQIAEKNGAQLRSTQKMLFDVNLELGQAHNAKKYLDILSTEKDFDYNIRLAKWNDHEGDLNNAIKMMEQALTQAKEDENKDLILWSATNLGDFYGHAGRIQEAYEQYLSALNIDPNNAYAMKGIAWIAFSHDKNSAEAKRIILALQKLKSVPDYDLLLSEIAAYEKDTENEKKYTQAFLEKIKNPSYGDMYNTYEIELHAEENGATDRLMQLAKTEVDNRPTPMSYSLLAWAQYYNGDKKTALRTIENNVKDKTSEPMAQFKMAMIYKANNLNNRAQALKTDLEGSYYELGPIMKEKIGSL